jgi:arylsulfatase A
MPSRAMQRLLSLALLLCAAAVFAQSPVQRPPNLIYILADDLGYGDVGCYGQQRFATPHIDRLAAEGMIFRQHYSGSTVCAPARSSLITGLHTGRTPVRGNLEVQPEGQHPLPADTVTIAKLLKRAGYVSGVFGKWGLGYPGSEGEPLKQGFDRFFGYNCQRLGHHYYPYHLWDDTRKVMLEDNAGQMKNVYAPELIHQKTLAFIEQNRDRPFFCFVASIIPHADLDAPERYMARHRGQYGPETPYAGVDSGPRYRQGPYESQPEPRAAFAAMINVLDDHVGEIVARVRALGLAENTLIIFTSDNGPHREGGADPDYFRSSGGLRGTKRDLYEGGIRVPTIAWWPGVIRAGSETGHVSAGWDVLPTFADLARVEVPPGLDGISFVPTLTGRGTQRQHDHLYWEFHERGGRMALRQGDWKIVRYNVLERPDAPPELYNLAQDPGETTNLAARHGDRLRAMDVTMRAARVDSPVFRFSHQGYLQKKD